MRTNRGLFQAGTLCAAALAMGMLGDTKAHAQPGAEAWVQRYGNVIDSYGEARKVVTDANGNVLVTGNSNAGISGDDWIIIKYSNAGVPLWTNRYNGPANDDDLATAVAVDSSGNVCAAGYSWNGTSFDYVTLAFSSAGVPLWTNRYNGPGNGDDYAVAVGVDVSGNAFVTGYSTGTGSGYDYATIAFSSAGVPLSTNRYNGSGNSHDRASAVAVDGSGNVFVTGQTDSGGAHYDYATIAYSSAGVPLWTNLYVGPGTDYANAVAVDGDGNVFVTGYSTGNGSGTDYATLAYSAVGIPLWTNRYNGSANNSDQAYAMAVDGSGNVIVTGYSTGSGSGYDYATIKYSTTGVAFWTNRYNGLGNGGDYAYAVAVDASGNVFVTGVSAGSGTNYDYATVKYSEAGVTLWTNRYNGLGNGADQASSVALDMSGNVFVTGRSYSSLSGSNFTTIAYSSAGVSLWTNRYDEPGNGNDFANGVAVDGSGNVFVTGRSRSRTSLSEDYATIGYSSAGAPLWTNRYDGPANGYDQATALAVDYRGNVFVTGYSHGGGSSAYDFATLAYSPTGVPLWTNRYSGPEINTDQAVAVAVDGSGNVIVTGYSTSSSSGLDYATIKYSSGGVALWTNRYSSGSGYSIDQPTAVAVDGSGKVFVAGSSNGNGNGYNYTTLAYSSAGAPLWTNSYSGPGNRDDVARAVAVDGNGNVYVTGHSWNGTSDDYATIAYSGAGLPLRTNLYNGPGNGTDYAFAVAVDGSGNVFVTGNSLGSGSFQDYATIAYSSAGVPLWTNRYDGPAHGDDFAKAVAVDSGGNVFVTGFSTGIGSGPDYATIAYSGAGVPLWTSRYNGPANGADMIGSLRCLAVAPDGVVVVGSSDGDLSTGAINDFAVVKYLIAIPLRIIATEKLGNDLRLRFTSQDGSRYTIQARANLAAGDWIDLVTNIPSGGATTQTIVTNALLEPRQFYRIQQSP